MILTKEVNIKLNKNIIKKYNYIGNPGDIITIDVNKLPLQSTKKINVKCDICGLERELEYRLYLKNYNKYNIYTCYNCSRFKYEKTSIKNYGFDNPSKHKSIKDKIEKTNIEKYNNKSHLSNDKIRKKIENTNLEKYGYINPMSNNDIIKKSIRTKKDKYGEDLKLISDKIIRTKKDKYGEDLKPIFDKIKKTNIEKYGVEYPLQSSIIYNKSIDTIFDKYGDYCTKDHKIREKMSNSLIEKTFNNIKKKYKNINFISKENNATYKIKCDKCNNIYEINNNLFHLRLLYKTEICTICNNPNNNSVSDMENKIYDFILLNYNKQIIRNDRKILNGKEIDIYLPDLNLAFEFNGIYWHSELFKDKNYHRNKYDLCEKNNINLIFIWEDDWVYNQDIIKSMILNKLGKTPNRIYARKTLIKEISDINIVKNFLNDNHIQGFSKSSIKIGLYFDNELVSLMTFGNRRINNKKEFELIRFCSKKYTNIIGGSNKLFNYFINNYNYDIIYSYSDNSFFNGNLYRKLNFDFMHETKNNYYWVIDNKRYHRFNFNKQKLIKMGYDKNKTEVDIMHSMNNYRIWSVGQKKWIYNKK